MDSAESREKYARPDSIIRTALFFIILAWMTLGPAYRQVLGGSSPVFRQWTMFREYGTGLHKGEGLIDAAFYVAADGKLEEINRFEILGYDKPKRAPDEVFKIVGKPGIERVSARLCRHLGDNADLRVKARMATSDGWMTLYNAEKNLCELKHDAAAQ
ncbi:MAG: hypothetical protein AB1598_07655 [Thermodesulfobacteriota bacterium]